MATETAQHTSLTPPHAAPIINTPKPKKKQSYDQYADGWDTSVVVNVDGEDVRFFHAVKKGVHRVFVDHPWFLSKVWGKTGAKLYGAASGADFGERSAAARSAGGMRALCASRTET